LPINVKLKQKYITEEFGIFSLTRIFISKDVMFFLKNAKM